MDISAPTTSISPTDAPLAFVAEAARGLAMLTPEDLEGGILTLPFGLSAWMKRGGVDMAGAVEGLLVLRSALLAASGLEAGCEPVPMLARDGRTALINLAVYLDGLMRRAARFARATRRDMAETAVAYLM